MGYLVEGSKRFDDLCIRILDPGLEPRDVADEIDFTV